MKYPPYPKSPEEIKSYVGDPEYMACTIVKQQNVRQLMAYRKLRLVLGDRLFLDQLVEALDIMTRTTTIHSPAGWLYAYLRDEANAVKRGARYA